MGIEHRILKGQTLKVDASSIQTGAITTAHNWSKAGGIKKVTMSGGAKLVTFTGVGSPNAIIPVALAPSHFLTLTGAISGSQATIRGQYFSSQGSFASLSNVTISFLYAIV